MKYFLIILSSILLYFLIWPNNVEPISWQSTSANPLPKTTYIKNYKLLKFKLGHGPEDIAVDNEGNVYGGLKQGVIEVVSSDNSKNLNWTNTAGRPLGLHFDQEKNLVIADAKRGLLKVSQDGKRVELLVDKYNDLRFNLTDDLDIASDGKIYFSDASYKYPPGETVYAFIESNANGRFLVYDPEFKKTTLLLDKLYYANGIAISQDEDFVLVVESTRYRVVRYWLKGERKGKADIFIDNIDGVPDGISRASDGGFWLPLVSRRSAILDKFSDKPFIRKIISRIPAWARPIPKGSARFLKLSKDGKIEQSFEIDPTVIKNVSSVQEHGNSIYLGSYSEKIILKITTSSILEI